MGKRIRRISPQKARAIAGEHLPAVKAGYPWLALVGGAWYRLEHKPDGYRLVPRDAA